MREDGYHNLQTIFQLLDYGDEVSLCLRNDGRIHRTNGLIDVHESDDLIIRAASLLKQYSGTALGADVGVSKRLPVGGGIGGGSSDAATTLVGLNKLWRCGLSHQELLNLGRQLGADVPVFINGRSAWAEGIGDELTPMVLPEKWYLVIHPDVFISTPKLFSSEVLTRNKNVLRMRDFPEADNENVFESVVRKMHSEVESSLEWLDNHSPARMTGTGSCIFASFDSAKDAESVLKKVPNKWRAFVSKATNYSTLYQSLELYEC